VTYLPVCKVQQCRTTWRLYLEFLTIDYCNITSPYLYHHIKDKNQIFRLEKVKSAVDFGVSTFDSSLTFKYHISEKVNKAYSVLGIMKQFDNT